MFLLVVQALAPFPVFGETALATLTDSSPEHSHYFCDLDEDQFNTFSAAVQNAGDVPVFVKVVWTVASETLVLVTIQSSVFILPPGASIMDVTGDFDPPPAGKTCEPARYLVEAQVFFGIDGMDFVPGDTVSFTFAAVPGVPIDIKPGSDPNSINVKSMGSIAVGILSVPGFDAPRLVAFDILQPTFGRTGDENSLLFCAVRSPEDVNGDGLLDLVCHFDTEEAGFKAGDTVGVLKAHLVDGTATVGTDSVRAFFPGDVDGDLDVDIFDAVRLGRAFDSRPGDSNWNLNADFNENGVIDIFDAALLGRYFDQHA